MADLIDRQKIKARFEPWLKVKDYSEGELNMLKAVLYEITVMPSAPQWIPVTEKMPERSGYYICTCHDGTRYRTSTLKWSNGWLLSGARSYWRVIAWMPLPEPYKEGD